MFKILYVEQNEHGGEHMNKVTNEIIAIKTEVRERNWEILVHECQQSEFSLKA